MLDENEGQNKKKHRKTNSISTTTETLRQKPEELNRFKKQGSVPLLEKYKPLQNTIQEEKTEEDLIGDNDDNYGILHNRRKKFGHMATGKASMA